MRVVFVVAVLLAAGIAGCSGKAPDKPAETVPQAFEDLQVSETRGAIRGIVVSEAVVPIANVTVKLLALNVTKQSDAQGAFVFTDLEAGEYFLSISKVGYFTVQASATVVPGVGDPPIVKVQLRVDATTQPYTEFFQWAAFLQCGAGISGVGSLNPCALTGSDNVHNFNFTGRVPDYIQTEAFWEGTQALGNDLNMGYYDPSTLAGNWKTSVGPSPLMVNATHDEIVAALGNDTGQAIVRVFPGTSQPLTVVIQQKYDIYETHFYGFVPRAGWMFVVDGTCNGPDQCGS